MYKKLYHRDISETKRQKMQLKKTYYLTVKIPIIKSFYGLPSTLTALVNINQSYKPFTERKGSSCFSQMLLINARRPFVPNTMDDSE